MAAQSKHLLPYGTQAIAYSLTFTERETLGVTVHPDTSVAVVAPVGTALDVIEAKLRPRRRWIVQQQTELAQFLPIVPPREYVSGETHLYLGRQYRLKVTQADAKGVKLLRGRFLINTPDKQDATQIKTQLDQWYRTQADRVFSEVLDACMVRVKRLGITERPPFAIRQMEKRWGSCSAEGKLLFNLKLIQAPKHLIAYVVTHELCHLQEHHHGAAFYEMLGRAMSDWQERKRQLSFLRVSR